MPATTPIFHCRATQEANHARLEHDHVVERELEELEEEGVHLAAELGVVPGRCARNALGGSTGRRWHRTTCTLSTLYYTKRQRAVGVTRAQC